MSLRAILNMLLVTLLLFSSGMVASLLFDKQKKLLSDSIDQQANTITTLISQDTLKLLVLDSPDAASDIIQKIQAVENLVLVELYNLDNKKVLRFQHPNYLKSVENQSQNTELSGEELNYIIKNTPLNYGNQVFGYLQLHFSEELINQHLSELSVFLIELLLIILVLTAFFAWFVDRFIIKRLSALNEALYHTARTQDYSTRLPEKGQDDIAQAYKNFNKLIKNTDTLTATLQDQVIRDNLTGLYNRFYISQKLLERFLKEPFDPKQVYALCNFNLDLFKTINDSYGHSTGDQFLKSLSEELTKAQQAILGKTPNYLARLSGDEFALLITNIDQKQLKEILLQFQKTIQHFEFHYLNQTLKVNVSVGAILFDNTYQDNEVLLSAADTACAQSKKRGRGRISTYWIDSEELITEKNVLSWFHRIQTALKQEAFVVYLQPIIASATNSDKTPSYEALIRLKDGDKILSPFFFMEPAERFNLTPEIDFYMVEKITQHLMQNPEFLNDVKHIAINLSGITLSSSQSAQHIIRIIEESGVPYNKLCFEVTETSALSNFEKAISFIEQLRDKGCKFSLDDFGTGVSSFDYLYKLPVNYLKIDGSFITDIATDPVKKEMVIAMQKIAVLMELETVAEFVENQEIVAELDQIGIHFHQGYHYSAPEPFDTFSKPSE